MKIRFGSIARWFGRAADVMAAGTTVLARDGVKIPPAVDKVQAGLEQGRGVLEIATREGGALHTIDAAFDRAHAEDLDVSILLKKDGVVVDEIPLTDMERDTADFAFDALDGVIG